VNYPALKFLSVWNEATEESVRGANVDNINTLFVAVLSDDELEEIAIETDPQTPVEPSVITTLTATQKAIKRTILNADNSYRVRFLTPVQSEIQVTISATVSTSYVVFDIREKIKSVLLDEYGKSASASKRGANKVLYRDVFALLKEKIPALSDGKADLQVTIQAQNEVLRPELWSYLTENSLTVTVTTLNILLPVWGGRF
jgi:hypothetical protein